MRSFHVTSHLPASLLPLAAALVLGACGAPAAPVTPATGASPASPVTPAASASPASPVTPPASAAPTPGATSVAFEKLSYDGRPSEEGKPLPVTADKRLKTQAELAALLDQLKAPATGRPTVDFTKKEVLAFYDEGGSNGCYELQLLSLQNNGAVITPVFAEKPRPGEDDDRVCTMVLVLPHYLLVAIDRTTLPVAGLDAAK